MNSAPRLYALLLTLLLALPVSAYEFPLSESSVRDAYFLGKRQASLGAHLLAKYTRPILDLKAGAFVSEARIETPFSHIAEYASTKLDYNAQDAVADFLGKPALFRVHLDICYKSDAPPGALRVKIIQNRKELVPLSASSSPYFPATDKRHFIPSVGEKLEFEFDPGQLDSTTLTILIDTPDGRHAEAEFDLSALR